MAHWVNVALGLDPYEQLTPTRERASEKRRPRTRPAETQARPRSRPRRARSAAYATCRTCPTWTTRADERPDDRIRDDDPVEEVNLDDEEDWGVEGEDHHYSPPPPAPLPPSGRPG